MKKILWSKLFASELDGEVANLGKLRLVGV
jgi:hypothetical protein